MTQIGSKNLWLCPICGSNAYQRFGGITQPAVKIDDSVNPPTYKKTSYKTGQHFMCKGCSVFFSNPRIFNMVHIGDKAEKEEIIAINSLQRINELFIELAGGVEEIEEMKKELADELKKAREQT